MYIIGRSVFFGGVVQRQVHSGFDGVGVGIVGLQLCGKTGGVCQDKVGRSSQFRFEAGAVPAPVGFAYDVVATVIDADGRMDILLQIAAAVNVCIDEVDVILEAERGSLLYNPSGYAGIVPPVDDVEKRCRQEVGRK